ncbi:MAG: hypothetical protein NWP80_00995 [Candidatus Gracilibacteria bacterium]|nr:hypothetical protein [Candidatus Gracilibacteria bacterium]
MYNSFLLKIELFFLIICLGYIIYYLGNNILYIIKSLFFVFINKEDKKNKNPTIVKVEKDSVINLDENTSEISYEEKEKLVDILKKVKLNISKKEYDLAQNYIVEGLSIDKFNKDLNIELASIYIEDKNYSKAEYIYKDLLLVHTEDLNLLKKLGYILSLQEKYDLSLEVYKKVYEKIGEDTETLNMLANITYVLEYYIDTISYVEILLKSKPRDIELLILNALSYSKIEEYKTSIEYYKKALILDPYNQNINKEIEQLTNIIEQQNKI